MLYLTNPKSFVGIIKSYKPGLIDGELKTIIVSFDQTTYTFWDPILKLFKPSGNLFPNITTLC